MLSAARIRELLRALNAELAADSVRGEVYLAGGGVMCLVFTQGKPPMTLMHFWSRQPNFDERRNGSANAKACRPVG